MLLIEKDFDIEQDNIKQTIPSEMNPWKAASISWLIPGLGHAYSHHWLKALIFFTIYMSLYVVRIYALCYSIFLAAITLFFQFYIFPFCAGLDVVHCYKISRSDSVEKSSIPNKNPWLAVFLSLVLPGLGHAYLKKWYLAIFFSLTYLSLNLLPVGHLFMVIFTILFKILVCIHVYKVSINTSLRKDFYKFVFFSILVLFSVRMALPSLSATYLIEVTSLKDATSMNPTIDEGDLIVINKFAYTFYNPKVGDIVDIDMSFLENSRLTPKRYFVLKKMNYNFVIKRIIAVGGDLVQINNEGIFINDILQRKFSTDECIGPSSLKISDSNEIKRLAVFEDFKVPKDCFFVLGDNIEDSFDSRDFGAVPKSMIVGKVVKIYYQ